MSKSREERMGELFLEIYEAREAEDQERLEKAQAEYLELKKYYEVDPDRKDAGYMKVVKAKKRRTPKLGGGVGVTRKSGSTSKAKRRAAKKSRKRNR